MLAEVSKVDFLTSVNLTIILVFPRKNEMVFYFKDGMEKIAECELR